MTLLRHGYTTGDLRRIARIVVTTTPGTAAASFDAAYGEAYSGAAEALYASDAAVSEQDLFRAAQNALRAHHKATRHVHGILPTGGHNVAAYWCWDSRTTRPVDDIVIPIAVRQVLRALPDRQRDILRAFADLHCDHQATAEHLGITRSALAQILWRARDAFERRWFDHEHPPAGRRHLGRQPRPDGELRPCGTIAAVRRHLARGEALDDACREERRRYNAPYLAASHERRKTAAAA